MDRPQSLIQLFHRRWNVPILAELSASDGSKFVTLSRRLGAPEGSVRASLDHLIECGWVIPNPGYGHPMRPEYILTTPGVRLGRACHGFERVVRRLGLEPLAGRKWPMPVLDTVGSGAVRFGQITGHLGLATSRAVSLALSDLESTGLIVRRLVDDRPTRAEYAPALRAGGLLGHLGRMAPRR